MNQITEESLKDLYNRANEYCIAKHGQPSDELIIDYDGALIAVFITSGCCGDPDERETRNISPDELNGMDLDKLVAERAEKERLRMIKEQEERKQRELKQKQIQEYQEKQEWQRLNKKYGK